ncbi:TetR family transcriptional regulator [Planobispora rosea]|uniref:TetR family transcriptional regulator n=1 Tax=Planobispora rosea TaxID=35762 RepID=A0A8J3RYM4_PLARO|nr:TetR/AcrR family transcriptional regulator [Planobispora rosea]GGS48859.1 TetR family transcriptional regulator [Planobispora rosea]GIH83723.1 TetR family transcriptional regulator [Planobispora rosea]
MRLDPSRERAILDATQELLAEVGFERMSVDQIARRAGASKATIYRRWPGKEALVVDLVCNHLELDVPAPPDTGTMREDLVEAVTGFCDVLRRKHSMIVGLLPGLLTNPNLAGALRDNVHRPDITGTVPLLDRARERGELAGAIDPARLRTVVEALVWHRLLITGEPLDRTFVEGAVDGTLLPLIRSWAGTGS